MRVVVVVGTGRRAPEESRGEGVGEVVAGKWEPGVVGVQVTRGWASVETQQLKKQNKNKNPSVTESE